MLSRERRIRQREEIERIFRFGKPLFFQELGCKVLKTPQKKTVWAIVCGKKTYARAVDRNRFRRVIAESLHRLEAAWPPECAVVVFPAKKPKKLGLKALFPVVQGLISKI